LFRYFIKLTVLIRNEWKELLNKLPKIE